MLRIRQLLSAERGAAMVLVAGAMVVLLGMAALSIDVGMLFSQRREMQTAVDAAAIAGAHAFDPADPVNSADDARDAALTVANENRSDLTYDITTDPSTMTVTVRGHKAVGTLFGRVLGFDEFAVGTKAAARKGPLQSPSEELLPIAIKDPRYDEDGVICDDSLDESGNQPVAGQDGEPDASRGCGIIYEDGDFGPHPLANLDFWKMIDGTDDGGPGQDGYIALRVPPGGGGQGNFGVLDLDAPSWDPYCESAQASEKYICQLSYGAYLTSAPPIVYVDTLTGNRASQTYEGFYGEDYKQNSDVVGRLNRDGVGTGDCTRLNVANVQDPPTVEGNNPGPGCPLLSAAPLIKEWPNGSSAPAHVTGWLAIGLVGTCNRPDVDPLDDTGHHPACEQTTSHGTAYVYIVVFDEADMTGFIGPGNVSETNTYVVKLIQ